MTVSMSDRCGRKSRLSVEKWERPRGRDGSEDRCEVKRQEKENTRALWKVWPTPRLPMWSRKGNYGLNSTFTPVSVICIISDTIPCAIVSTGIHQSRSATSDDRRCTRVLMTAARGRTANRRNEPIIEGTVVIFPKHRRWFSSAKTRRVIMFPICIDLAVSLFLTSHFLFLFLSFPLHVPLLVRNGLPRRSVEDHGDAHLWSQNSKLLISQTPAVVF